MTAGGRRAEFQGLHWGEEGQEPFSYTGKNGKIPA